MDIHDAIAPAHIVLGLKVETKTRLLKELACHAARHSTALASDIAIALASRERLGSTGLGEGIAIPHAKIRGLARPYAAFVRLDRPCPFEAIDDRDVDIVVLLLLPEISPQEHLNLLARIARMLRNEALVAKLRQAATTAEIHALLSADNPPATAAA